MSDENKLSTAAIESCISVAMVPISTGDKARAELSALLQRIKVDEEHEKNWEEYIDALDEKNDALWLERSKDLEAYRSVVKDYETAHDRDCAEIEALRDQLNCMQATHGDELREIEKLREKLMKTNDIWRSNVQDLYGQLRMVRERLEMEVPVADENPEPNTDGEILIDAIDKLYEQLRTANNRILSLEAAAREGK